MAHPTFLVLLLVVADCLSYEERVTYDHYGDDHLGYFIKTVKQEKEHLKARENIIGAQGNKDEFRGGSRRNDLQEVVVTSLIPREGNVEGFSSERVKNDSALPLHVTSTARQECLEGYQADENGTCQKSLAPKGEKSFKLRRRKRGEQPKMSYADVLKYGRTPPTTVGFKAEILTTTPKIPEMRANSVITTLKPTPSEAMGVTIPTAVPGKIGGGTAAPVRKTEQGSKPTIGEVVTTASSVTSITKAGITAVPSPVKPAVTSAATAAPSVGKAAVPTTVAPRAAVPTVAPTKPSGLVIPTIPTGVKSVLADINSAFLSGEKHSIAAQAANPNPPAAKEPAVTRPRRWIHAL